MPEFPRSAPRRSGFTIIELMIIMLILGVLAALAVPAYMSYMRRSKTSEATTQLGNLFRSAASLYVQHNIDQRSIAATTVTNCIAQSTPRTPETPNQNKQKFESSGGFLLMPHHISDYVYYGYEIVSVGTNPDGLTCGYLAGSSELYTFLAEGDLDGDGIFSRFELAVGSDADDALYHARGFYITNEHE